MFGEYAGISVAEIVREIESTLWEMWRWVSNNKLAAGGLLVAIWLGTRLLIGRR